MSTSGKTVSADSPLLADLRILRETLHTIPEPSWNEQKTSRAIQSFLSRRCAGAEVTQLTGTGFMVVFRGRTEGPRTVIRCELDGVRVTESGDHAIRSNTPEFSHACGHDGHMAVSAGLAAILCEKPPAKGNVALLFQPAEESGEGAAAVMEHPSFKSFNPDYIFAFHNIPGAPEGTIIVRDNLFAFASKGMHITLTGTPAHAASPDSGINPTNAALDLARAIPLSAVRPSLATITYIRVGSPDMGRAPFDAELSMTLRSPRNTGLGVFSKAAETLARSTAEAAGLKVAVSWSDIFPETANNPACTAIIRQAAACAGFTMTEPAEPFPWSEDFGYYTALYHGALFGIGSGHTAPLHDQDYSFPDSIISPALEMYLRIIDHIHGSEH